MINFIIPCYNEAHRMQYPLQKLCEYLKQQNFSYHLTFIDDWSTDWSSEKIDDCIKPYNISYTILQYTQNQWKGHAIQYGIQHSITETTYYFLRDIDNATSLEEISRCINQIQDSKYTYDIIIGKRVFPHAKRTTTRKLWQLLSGGLIQFFLDIPYKDTQCGCKVFSKDLKWIALKVPSMRRWWDFAFLCLAHHTGYKINEHEVIRAEVPDGHISYKDYFITLKELFITYRIYRTIT